MMTTQNELSWVSETKETLKLALPMALTQLGTIALNTIDVMFIGRLGPQALAASALASSLWIAFFLFSVGVLTAVPAIAAQAAGAHKPRTVRRIARQGIWMAFSLGVPFSFLFTFGRELLILFGQTVENATAAGIYLDTLLLGTTPALLFIALRGYIAAYSIVRPALIITFSAIPLNAFLDYALIFGNFGFPRLELWGAGLATSIVHLFTLICIIFYLLYSKHFKRKAVLARIWRHDWPHYIEILKIGLPIGALLVMEAGLFSAMALLMGWIGTMELAAHQIALQIASITFMVPLGISQAATIRVGHSMGKNLILKAKRSAYVSLSLGTIIMGTLAAVMILWPEPIIQLFLNKNHEDTQALITLGASYLFIAALFQLSDGAQVISGGILRGMKDTQIPMYFGIIGYWVIGFGGGYYMAFHTELAGVGIWLGLLIGLTVTAILNISRFTRLIRIK